MPKNSLRLRILSQRVKPKTFRRALLTAVLQLDISEAVYSLTEHAYVNIGTQLQYNNVMSVCSCAPGKEFRIEFVARKKAARSGCAAKPIERPALRVVPRYFEGGEGDEGEKDMRVCESAMEGGGSKLGKI